MGKLLWRRRLLGTYMGGGEKAGLIGYNSHFHAVIARLIKDSLLKFYKYIRIFFISGIQVSNMVLWLWSRAIDPDDLSPFLLKIVGLKFKLGATQEEG